MKKIFRIFIITIAIVILTVVLFVALFKMDSYKKIIMEIKLSPNVIWEKFTSPEEKVFWRNDIINIVNIKDRKYPAFKEIFIDNSEKIYEVIELKEKEKFVIKFNSTYGIENISFIVKPFNDCSRIALIHSVNIINPFNKITILFNKKDTELHKTFDNLVISFTNYLRKENISINTVETFTQKKDK